VRKGKVRKECRAFGVDEEGIPKEGEGAVRLIVNLIHKMNNNNGAALLSKSSSTS